MPSLSQESIKLPRFRLPATATQVVVARSARTRLQVVAIAVSLAVLIAGWFPVAPIRDAATLQEVPEVSLVRPVAYVDFAPFSDVLDTVSLLSERQHIAVLLGVLAIWALWRFARRAERQRNGWRDHAHSLAVLVACISVVYVAALYLPRPMARLASLDADLVRVDFHSHTESSKDARPGYSAERSAAWHHSGGYDVAYVTDHSTFTGAEQGLAGDPSTWNGSTVLLPGIEVNWKGEHVGVLGGEQRSRCVLSANLHDIDLRSRLHAGCGGVGMPIMVWNHPRDPKLASLPLTGGTIRAIEVANGALHSMDLVHSKRDAIVGLARQHDLAMLSGTDRHGWGYAVPNWTLIRLEGWRHLDRDELAERIERAIRVGGFHATHVVERTTADPGASATALAFSVVLVPWRMLTALSGEERRMWLAWICAIVVVQWHVRRRRVSRLGEVVASRAL